MKKLILAIVLLASSISSAFAAWEEGDTAYVYVGGENKPMGLFSAGDLAYYAKISIERVTSKKVKGYITKICWRASNGKAYCNGNRSEYGYRPGSYAWFYKSDLNSWIPER